MKFITKSSAYALVLATALTAGQALAQPRGGHGPGPGFGDHHHRDGSFYSEFREKPEFKADFDKIDGLHNTIFIEQSVLEAYINNPAKTEQVRAQAQKVVDLRREFRLAHDSLMKKLPKPPQGATLEAR